jgi:hypothetical protein
LTQIFQEDRRFRSVYPGCENGLSTDICMVCSCGAEVGDVPLLDNGGRIWV